MTWLWIAIGGALGSVARYGASLGIARMFGETFPWGTLLVNVTGSFAIGLFSTMTGTEGRMMVSPEWRQFFMVGVCGGYTTFSSFSLQTLNLMRDGQWLYAGANVVFSVVLCLAGAWAGHMMAMQLNQGR
jgi:CrcB protein